MSQTLQERIAAALRGVVNPRTGTDVLTAEMIRDVATTTAGKVRLTILLSPSDPATLVRDVRETIERIDGVSEVRVDVKDASETNGRTAPPPPPSPVARTLPVMNAAPAAAPRPSAPTPVAYPNLGRIIAVSSGKGGVGKSTVAANLALALAAQGARVGLLDADIYGPSMPRMMGLQGQRPTTADGKTLEPPRGHGIPVMSIGFLVDADQPMAWRGPMVTQALGQMLTDTRWGALDYLVVDMPPGTGDIQLTLTQRVPVSGAVIVTTPQEIALLDARKGLQLFRKVGVPVLGIVENMGLHRCPACGHESHVFDAGGGRELAARYGTTLLGELPLDGAIRERADSGRPTVVSDPDSPVARTYHEIARRAAGALAASAIRGAVKMPEIRIEGE